MFDLTIKDEDERWLNTDYPSLKIHFKDDGIAEITGALSFSMCFQDEGKPYVINPAVEHSNGINIKDEYQIRIDLKGSEYSDLPQVYETGSRFRTVAESKNLKLIDLHINPNNAACLCIKQEESINLPGGFNLPDYFNNLVIPFFYAQSFFEKFNSWPWGQYSHGLLGHIEWYMRQENPTSLVIINLLQQLRKDRDWKWLQKILVSKYSFKGHNSCCCDKSNKIRNCHPVVLRGIWKLKSDIYKFDLGESTTPGDSIY